MLKSNLPDIIVKNGLTYVRNYVYFYPKQLAVDMDTSNVKKQIEQAKQHGLKYLTVKVLHKNLRGRTDLHNKPYQPHTYVFVADKLQQKN